MMLTDLEATEQGRLTEASCRQIAQEIGVAPKPAEPLGSGGTTRCKKALSRYRPPAR